MFGPGTCVKQGDTVLSDFFAQLVDSGLVANESVDGWTFKPGSFHVDSGDTINAVNTGGEFHTFTKITKFGGGCIAPLNQILGLTPVPECTALAPDGMPTMRNRVLTTMLAAMSLLTVGCAATRSDTATQVAMPRAQHRTSVSDTSREERPVHQRPRR